MKTYDYLKLHSVHVHVVLQQSGIVAPSVNEGTFHHSVDTVDFANIMVIKFLSFNYGFVLLAYNKLRLRRIFLFIG